MEISRKSSKKNNCDDKDSGGISNCLVCYTDIDLHLSLSKTNEKAECTTLAKHLDVILILKQIFELSSEQLREYLVQNPDNVEKWITVCGKCTKLIDKYKNIQKELFKVKLKIIGITKRSFNDKSKKRVTFEDESKRTTNQTQETESDGDDDDGSRLQSGLNVTLQTRRFIRERDYDSGHKFVTIPDTTTDHFKLSTTAAEADDDNPDQNEVDKTTEYQDNHDDFDDDDGDFFESADSQLFPPSSPENDSKPLNSQRRHKPELILPKPNNNDQDWLPDSDDSDAQSDNQFLDPDIEISDIKPTLPLIPTPTKKACHLCPKSFHDKSTLTRHLINIHKQPITRKPKKCYGKSTKCHTCSKDFPTPSLLHYHQQYTHLKQFDFHCPICLRGFRTSKDLDYHKNVCESKSSGKSKLSCHHKGCKARYWNEDGLKKHLELHEKGVSWQCHQCGKSFMLETALKVHEKMYHGKDGQPLEEVSCEFCGDKFSTKISLYTHKKISLKCQLNYQGKSEAECKLTCETCGDKFGSQRALTMHADTRHKNKYPFNCEEKGCGKGFVQKSKLTYHLKKVHGVGEYPWRCEVEGCEMGYDSKKVLDEHMTTHGGEKEYECWECGKRFYFQKGLIGHRKKVHASQSGGKGVTCEECGKGFKSLVYLRCHLRSCHGIGAAVLKI